MPEYDPPRRARTDPRPRYYDDDDASAEESYYAPAPRRHRRPPPPDSSDIPPPPMGHPRRPSILISPDETASQRETRRRSRSIDKVRLQAESSDDGYDDDRQRGPPKPRLTRRLSHDLERKTTDESKKFRAKRDGYESDEGETLRKSKRPSGDPRDGPRRRDYDDYDDPYVPLEKKDSKLDRIKDKLAMPLRGKPRAPDDRDDRNPPPVEYGAAPIAAGAAGAAVGAAAASGRPRPRGYDTDPERPRRRRTWGEDDMRAGGRDRGRDRYDDDGYDRRPRPRFEDDDRYRSGRKDRYDDYDDYDRRDKRRDDRDRRGGLAPPRPKYDAYYSDSREDRAYPRPRNRDRDDRRARDDYSDRRDRDRYRDEYYGRDRRDKDRRSKGKSDDWQKQAGVLFTTYALPIIKREGTKWLKREAQNYLQKRGG